MADASKEKYVRVRLWLDPKEDRALIARLESLAKTNGRNGELHKILKLGLESNPSMIGPDFEPQRDREKDTYEVQARLPLAGVAQLGKVWKDTGRGRKADDMTNLARLGFKIFQGDKKAVSSRPAAPAVKATHAAAAPSNHLDGGNTQGEGLSPIERFKRSQDRNRGGGSA
jgi:hypothetical protein